MKTFLLFLVLSLCSVSSSFATEYPNANAGGNLNSEYDPVGINQLSDKFWDRFNLFQDTLGDSDIFGHLDLLEDISDDFPSSGTSVHDVSFMPSISGGSIITLDFAEFDENIYLTLRCIVIISAFAASYRIIFGATS